VFKGLINDEAGRLWKETVVTSFDILFPALTSKERATPVARVCVMGDINTERYMFCGPASSFTRLKVIQKKYFDVIET
jgi:hypothetical protein